MKHDSGRFKYEFPFCLNITYLKHFLFQIRNLREKNKFHFLFIVPRKIVDWYESLSKFLQGTSRVDMLSKTPNFGNIISKQYKDLKNTVKVNYNHQISDDFQMEVLPLFSECKKDNDFIICEGVEEKSTLSFNTTINVTFDFCERNEVTEAEIKVDGINDKLVLKIECEKCKCQDITKNATVCMSRGDLRCGGCQC